MPLELPFTSIDRLAAFLLVFLRMTGLMVAAPLLSHRAFPIRVRIWVAFMLAVLTFPLAWQVSPDGLFAGVFRQPVSTVVAVAGELALGWVVGWTASLIVWAAQLAGHVIGQEIGLSLAAVYDPVTEISGSPTTTLMFMIALLVFMLLGGHHVAIWTVARSFEVAPPGTFPFTAENGAFLAGELGSEMWEMGLRMALPVMVALLLVTVSTGILARAVPEMNVFIIGLAIRVFFGLMALLAVLPFVTALFGDVIAGMSFDLDRLLESWGGR